MRENLFVFMLICIAARRRKNNPIVKNELELFVRIEQETAQDMMETEKNYIIVDVRGPEEFEKEHVLGAVNLPIESISMAAGQLPDKEQLIFVYCTSGGRSGQASEKLASMGYKRIYNFGGMDSWTGDTARGQ